VGVWLCFFVGLLPRQLEIVCIDPHQTGSVGEGIDHLQLIKFWPSRAPGKRVCGAAGGGAKVLAPPYYSQRAVFASPPSAFFIGSCFSLCDVLDYSMLQTVGVSGTPVTCDDDDDDDDE